MLRQILLPHEALLTARKSVVLSRTGGWISPFFALELLELKVVFGMVPRLG
jgi:hypothetical protein